MFRRIKENFHIVGLGMFMIAALIIPNPVVHADEANVHFGSTSYETKEGDPFNVGVYITTEQGFGKYAVTMKYDPESLEYVGGADSVDEENGLLVFTGTHGGPEIRYMVNFNVIGEEDTSVSFNSAAVNLADNSNIMTTSVAADAPIKVEKLEDEEEEAEEAPANQAEIHREVVVKSRANSPELQMTAHPADENPFFENDYFLITAITVVILLATAVVSILLVSLVKKAKRKKKRAVKKTHQKFDENLDVLDLEDEALEEEVQDASKDDIVIDVKDVTMEFKVASAQTNGIKDYIIHLLKRQISYRKFYALNHVSFSVKKGEVVGIIGTNGSGKSTILKIVSGALHPTSGHVDVDRRKVQLLTLGTGFDMELTGRENVYLNGAIIGYSKQFLDEHYDEIVEFAELQDFMDEKVKNYSSGMVSRLGFAIATAGDAAEILILDEVLSVGDEFFRKKSLKRVKEMIHSGSTVLLVSHGMGTIRENCSKVVWIEKGELRMVGTPDVVCKAYQQMQERGIPDPVTTVSEVS